MTTPIDRPALERRALGDVAQVQATGRTISGYGVVFGSPSEPLTALRNGRPVSFVEMVDRRALDQLRSRRDVKFLHSHDASRVLGSSKSGTLRLDVDATGLRFTLDTPNSPDGDNLLESVRRRDLDGVSFGFRVLKDAWQDDAAPPIRTLLDIDVFEISAVAFPAYQGTSIEARALDHAATVAARHQSADLHTQLQALKRRVHVLTR